MSDAVEGEAAVEPPRDLRRELTNALRRCTPKQRAYLYRVAANEGQKWSAASVSATGTWDDALSKYTIAKWLRLEQVQKVLALHAEVAQLDSDVTHARLEREYERIAFASLGDFRGIDGKPLPFAQWTPDMCAAISEIEFNEDGSVKRFKLHRKAPAQDTLSRVKGYLVDRSELILKDAPPPVVHIVERVDPD